MNPARLYILEEILEKMPLTLNLTVTSQTRPTTNLAPNESSVSAVENLDTLALSDPTPNLPSPKSSSPADGAKKECENATNAKSPQGNATNHAPYPNSALIVSIQDDSVLGISRKH